MSAQRKPRNFVKAVFLGIALAIMLVIWPILPIGGPFGYIFAKRDVARGFYELKGDGIPAGWKKDYRARMLKKYGIIITGSGGCLAGEYERTYEQSYNSVQAIAFSERQGLDLWVIRQECMKEAQSQQKAFEEASNAAPN